MRTRGGLGAVPILKKAPTHFYKQEMHSILQKLNLWVCYNARVHPQFYIHACTQHRPGLWWRAGLLWLPGVFLALGALCRGSPDRRSLRRGQVHMTPPRKVIQRSLSPATLLKPIIEEADFSDLHPQEGQQEALSPGQMQDFRSLTLKARCSTK